MAEEGTTSFNRSASPVTEKAAQCSTAGQDNWRDNRKQTLKEVGEDVPFVSSRYAPAVSDCDNLV